MYKNILVPMALDHELSQSLFGIAKRLLRSDGDLHAIHVIEAPFGLARATLSEDHFFEVLERARKLMSEKLQEQEGVQGQLVEGHVSRSIVEFAESRNIDCIVMGSHKPVISDYLLGSTAAYVVRHAPCSVHVHR